MILERLCGTENKPKSIILMQVPNRTYGKWKIDGKENGEANKWVMWSYKSGTQDLLDEAYIMAP